MATRIALTLSFVLGISFLARATSAATLCESLFVVSNAKKLERDLDGLPAVLIGEKNDRPYSVQRRFDPIQKISIVIPTYRELYNGNVKRLVESLAQQKLAPQMIEIVFVVNNSPAIAANPTDPIFIENQKTLAILKKLGGKFNVQVLDLATTGIETNMGILRQRGSEFAIRRSRVPPEKHVIVHMDADTVFEPDFLPRLYDLYSNFAFDSVLVQRIHVLAPDADDLMLKTFYKFKRGDTDYKFNQALTYARGGVATPQISSRASALLAVGGFPPIRQDEDFRFTRRLSKAMTYFYSPDIHVIAQDRARQDGFDARLRDNWNQAMTHDLIARRELETPFQDAIVRKIADLSLAIGKQRIDVQNGFTEFFKFASKLMNTPINPWYESWDSVIDMMNRTKDNAWEYYAMTELFRPVFDLKTVNKGRYMLLLAGDFVTGPERDLIEDRVRLERENHDRVLEFRLTAIRNILLKQEVCTGACVSYSRDPFIHSLANSKSPIHQRIIEIARNHYGLSGVIQRLKFEYPDWVVPYDETPNKSNMFEMRLLTELLVAGHNEPAKYPGFAKLYNELRGLQ